MTRGAVLGRAPEYRPKITEQEPDQYLEWLVDCPNCETTWYVQIWDEETNETPEFCPGCGERQAP